MNPVTIDTDDFLRAHFATRTRHEPDGSAHNDLAMWWRLNYAEPGATWHVIFIGAEPGGPAVVDDFGDLVLAGLRS
jgi:hypothetical protein